MLILLLPFERLLTFDLFGFTVKPAYLLALMFVMWLAFSGIFRPFLKMRLKYLISNIRLEEYLLILLVVWSFLSSVWSLAPGRSLIYSALLLLLIIVFMIIRRTISSGMRERVTNIIIWLGVAVSILALLQFFIEPVFGYKIALLREQYGSRVFAFPRPQATFLEPLFLANFLLFPILIAMNKELRIMNNDRAVKIQYSMFNIQKIKKSGSLVVMLIAFLLTLSRGAYLALGAGSVILIILLFFTKKTDWSRFMTFFKLGFVSILISLSCVYIVAGEVGLHNFLRQVINTQDLPPTNQIESLKNRELSQDIAIENIKNNFLSGIGLAAFGSLPEYHLLKESGEWQTANNQYLEIWVELGIVGLILFLLIISLALIYQISAIKKGLYDNIVYLSWIIALLIHYITFSSLFLLYIWIFLAISWPAKQQNLPETTN